jgi:hypothetical protein
MRLERPEKMRGRDKWMEAEATIQPADRSMKAFGMLKAGRKASPGFRSTARLEGSICTQAVRPIFTYDTSPRDQLLEGKTILVR